MGEGQPVPAWSPAGNKFSASGLATAGGAACGPGGRARGRGGLGKGGAHVRGAREGWRRQLDAE